MLYADGDSDLWAPSACAARATRAGVAVVVEEGMPHAFSVAPKTNERVVQLVCAMLNSMP